jgi:hypothetical protein
MFCKERQLYRCVKASHISHHLPFLSDWRQVALPFLLFLDPRRAFIEHSPFVKVSGKLEVKTFSTGTSKIVGARIAQSI